MVEIMAFGFSLGVAASVAIFLLGAAWQHLRYVQSLSLQLKPQAQKNSPQPKTILRSANYSVSEKHKPLVRDDAKAMENEVGWATPD